MNVITPKEIADVAIIGAGLSGLAAAHHLQAKGLQVMVIDKGRGPGGRTSTRRLHAGDGLDHGAQFLTLSDPAFQDAMEPLMQEGTLQRWEPRGAETWDQELWVGVPGMNAVAKFFAERVPLRCGVRIEGLTRDNGVWDLLDDAGTVQYRAKTVVISAPAPQAAQLLDPISPMLASRAASIEMLPCWVALVEGEAGAEPELAQDVWASEESPLALAVRIASKPGRGDRPRWSLHGSNSWSRTFEEAEADWVADKLVQFAREQGIQIGPITGLSAHRWRFARPASSLGQKSLLDLDLAIGLCGDWVFDEGLEAAFLSGLDLAETIIAKQKALAP